MKYVHKKCLDIWRQYSGQGRVCPNCNTRYNMNKPRLEYELEYNAHEHIPGGNMNITFILGFIGLNLLIDERHLVQWQPIGISLHVTYFLYYGILYIKQLIKIKNIPIYITKAMGFIWLPILHYLLLRSLYMNTLVCGLPLSIMTPLYLLYHSEIIVSVNQVVREHNTDD